MLTADAPLVDAADALRQLYEVYPTQTDGQRALVRLIVLYRGKLDNPQAARFWITEANHNMPAGAWREYLEEELSSPGAPSAGVREGRVELFQGPGSWRSL